MDKTITVSEDLILKLKAENEKILEHLLNLEKKIRRE
jgi:hypothetical protein